MVKVRKRKFAFEIYWPFKNHKLFFNFVLWRFYLAYCIQQWIMDMWWQFFQKYPKFFSKISQIIGQFGQMGRINCGVFLIEISAHFVIVFLGHDFLFINIISTKTKLWRQIYLGWDMNLGCKEFSHHVSVVVHGFNNKFWKYESSSFKFVFDEK